VGEVHWPTFEYQGVGHVTRDVTCYR